MKNIKTFEELNMSTYNKLSTTSGNTKRMDRISNLASNRMTDIFKKEVTPFEVSDGSKIYKGEVSKFSYGTVNPEDIHGKAKLGVNAKQDVQAYRTTIDFEINIDSVLMKGTSKFAKYELQIEFTEEGNISKFQFSPTSDNSQNLPELQFLTRSTINKLISFLKNQFKLNFRVSTFSSRMIIPEDLK